jgi:cytochrome b561
MAALILGMIPVGIVMVRLERGALQDTLFDLHRSFGAIVLALAMARLAVRLRGAPPPDPGLTRFELVASKAVHRTIYLLIFVLPILGWAGSSAFGAPVTFFWLFDLPPLLAKDVPLAKFLLSAHATLAFLMAGLVALHIAGALRHALVRRDDVLKRMLPGRRPS